MKPSEYLVRYLQPHVGIWRDIPSTCVQQADTYKNLWLLKDGGARYESRGGSNEFGHQIYYGKLAEFTCARLAAVAPDRAVRSLKTLDHSTDLPGIHVKSVLYPYPYQYTPGWVFEWRFVNKIMNPSDTLLLTRVDLSIFRFCLVAILPARRALQERMFEKFRINQERFPGKCAIYEDNL